MKYGLLLLAYKGELIEIGNGIIKFSDELKTVVLRDNVKYVEPYKKVIVDYEDDKIIDITFSGYILIYDEKINDKDHNVIDKVINEISKKAIFKDSYTMIYLKIAENADLSNISIDIEKQ